MPKPSSNQETKRLTNDEELDLDFLEIMDKALSESKLQKDHPSTSSSEAPSVKSLIPVKDPAHVEVRSSIPSVQDRPIQQHSCTSQ